MDNTCVNRPCDNDVNYIPSKQGINKTQVMITNLSSFVNYKLMIYSRNRVSDLARELHGLEGNFALINVITLESRKFHRLYYVCSQTHLLVGPLEIGPSICRTKPGRTENIDTGIFSSVLFPGIQPLRCVSDILLLLLIGDINVF